MPRWSIALAAFLPALLLHAEEPAAPDAEQIAAWVKQLGSEEYGERRAALEKLKQAGEAAVEPLENAIRTSDDMEVKSLAKEALPFARAQMERQVWKRAMQGQWIQSLSEGKIVGPLLGSLAGRAPSGPQSTPQASEADPESRRDTFKQENKQSAVDAGMMWLARNQEPDGHWDSAKWGATTSADVDHTALAFLTFLGAGHTEKVGQYKDNVTRAALWLSKMQRPNGAIAPAGWEEVDGLTHAVAGLALAEAAGMARVPGTVAAGQKAIDYTVQIHQSKKDGEPFGFGRLVRDENPDLVTSAFYAMQLKSAKVAGLRVDPAALNGLIKFLDSVDAKNAKDGGFFSYVPGGKPTPEATLMGCLARQFLGWKKECLAAQAAAAVKVFHEPTTAKDDSNVVANYFGTLTLFQQGGDLWKSWNEPMKKNLLEAQHSKGAHDGSWEASGAWTGAGRIFATAMNTLCLEVYYRYLPLYKE